MPKGALRTCSNGHQYYKSSDCPACPICEEERKPENGFLSALAAPARRALENAGITTLQKLSRHTEKEILKLSSIPKLKKELKKNNMAFRNR